MSSTSEVINADIDVKPEFQNSVTEASQKYSLGCVDGGEAADNVYNAANPSQPGFTKHDQRDMYRMGKIQEFKVSSTDNLLMIIGIENQSLTLSIEELSASFCIEFCGRFVRYVGISLNVSGVL